MNSRNTARINHRFARRMSLYSSITPDEFNPWRERKNDRENYTAIVILLGSFILMCSVGFIASTFLPASSGQSHTTTNTLDDITPMLTPTQMMGK